MATVAELTMPPPPPPPSPPLITIDVASLPTAPVSTVPWNMVTLKAFWRTSALLDDGFYRGIAPAGSAHGIDRCPSGFTLLSWAECRNVAANTPPTSLMNAADCAEHCDHTLAPSATRFTVTGNPWDPAGCFFYAPFGFYYKFPPASPAEAARTRTLRSPICKKVDPCLMYTWVNGVYTCALSSDAL